MPATRPAWTSGQIPKNNGHPPGQRRAHVQSDSSLITVVTHRQAANGRKGIPRNRHYPADSVPGRRSAERITHNVHAARAAGTASAIRERPAYQDVIETG